MDTLGHDVVHSWYDQILKMLILYIFGNQISLKNEI